MRLTNRHNVGVPRLTQFDLDIAFGGKDPYRVYSEKPDRPPKDTLLLERIPHTQLIQVKFDDNTIRVLIYDGTLEKRREWVQIGIREDLLDEVMTHMWNFNIALVKVDFSKKPFFDQDEPNP